jgi:hypothetical protein
MLIAGLEGLQLHCPRIEELDIGYEKRHDNVSWHRYT